MKARHFMTLIFTFAMILGNVLASDLTLAGMLRAAGIGLVAGFVFCVIVFIANIMTRGGVDKGFEQIQRRR